MHAFTEFCDGSVLAQLGFPSMELPILYALTHPERLPDWWASPLRSGGRRAAHVRAGAYRKCSEHCSAGFPPAGPVVPLPAVFNAANEVAVAAFLEGVIPFGRISETIEMTLEAHRQVPATLGGGRRAADRWAPCGGPPERRDLMLLTLLSLIVVLGVLVFVHEAGHFLAAKWAGIYVHRFSLGLGPPIPWLTFRRGETEYSISWLPLGGYVKMASSEEDIGSSALEGGAPTAAVPPNRVFEAKPIWKRMVVILAGVTMNALFAWAMFSFLAYKNGRQIDPVTTVGRVLTEGLPQEAAALKQISPGSKIIRVNGDTVSSWDEVVSGIANTSAPEVRIDLDRGQSVFSRSILTPSRSGSRPPMRCSPFGLQSSERYSRTSPQREPASRREIRSSR